MPVPDDSLRWTFDRGGDPPMDFRFLLRDAPAAPGAKGQGTFDAALAYAQAHGAYALDDEHQLPRGVAVAPTTWLRILALELGSQVDEALMEWLKPADVPRDAPRLCLLVSPTPLTLKSGPGDLWSARAAFRRALQTGLVRQLELKHLVPGRDRLLVVSAGARYSAVRELSAGDDVLGHELVVSGLNHSPGGARFWRERSLEKPLRARTIGYGRGAGFAELHVQRGLPSAPPEARIYFHMQGSRRELELRELLGESWASKAPELRLDPKNDGGFLPLEVYPQGAEDVVARCLRLSGRARIDALVHAEHDEVIARRNRRPDAAPVDQRYTTGLALSGGGIRSATVSLGFMRELQQAGELSKYDYVSSVSGGSYASGYLQVMTSQSILTMMRKKTEPRDMYDDAFRQVNVEELHRKGSFLAVGQGALSKINYARLGTSFLTSLVQHWMWLLSVVITLGAIEGTVHSWVASTLCYALCAGAFTVLLRMFVSRDVEWYPQRVQRFLDALLNFFETAVLVTVIAASSLWLLGRAAPSFKGALRAVWRWLPTSLETMLEGLAQGLASHLPSLGINAWMTAHGGRLLWWGLLVTAFLTRITSPNSTSLHRYYSARLADTFLTLMSRNNLREKLRVSLNIFQQIKRLNVLARKDCYGPYPIFNGCVNLLGDDPAFAGQQTGDYFAFTPMFCGSKLVGYASTDKKKHFGKLTLAEALTCSGAAISPFQGRAMPSLKSTLLWLFNLRTDLWLPNPAHPSTSRSISWGPWRQLRALTGNLDTTSRYINISDGAFIDSLGVYELLRRRCQRIVALDATYDPLYDFHTLRNLVQRARFELKLSFNFHQEPEDVIKPDVASGISRGCVVSAEIVDADGQWVGHFVYVKTARLPDEPRAPTSIVPSRAYATYHPEFPQHSTGDQFFDPLQWQAYHDLGREMGRQYLATAAAGATPRRGGSPSPLCEAAQ